jgi:hypothetical protein
VLRAAVLDSDGEAAMAAVLTGTASDVVWRHYSAPVVCNELHKRRGDMSHGRTARITRRSGGRE